MAMATMTSLEDRIRQFVKEVVFCQERKGRCVADLDCRSVLRELVKILDGAKQTCVNLQFKEGSPVPHWIVEWKGVVIDPTVLQFCIKSFTITEMANLKAKWCEKKDITIPTEYHNETVCTSIANHEDFAEFRKGIVDQPYYIGEKENHPLYLFFGKTFSFPI